jgi:ribonucleoside-diphosphate reductase alpha subunit
MSFINTVIGRNGFTYKFEKHQIFSRLLNTEIEISQSDKEEIVSSVVNQLSDKIHTTMIDELLAKKCHHMAIKDSKFETIALIIKSESLDKTLMHSIQNKYGSIFINPLDSYPLCLSWMLEEKLIGQKYYETAIKYCGELISFMNSIPRRHLAWAAYSVFNKYAKKTSNDIYVELPEFIYMRVALSLCNKDIDFAKKIYIKLNNKQISFGTPIFSFAGTCNEQLASCFIPYVEDTKESIDDLLTELLIMGSMNGGTASGYTSIRGYGSRIRSLGTVTKGIMGIYKGVEGQSEVYSQGVRLPTHAAYLEPWHCDIKFHLSKCMGDGKKILFPALWMPDEFFRRMLNDEDWYFFNPMDVLGMENMYDKKVCHNILDNSFVNDLDFAFTYHYRKAISDGKFVSKMKATEFWEIVLISCMQNGLPYICCKDTCNRLSNLHYVGPIKSSNLCTEIYEPQTSDLTAVCNIGSIVLTNIDTDEEFDDSIDILVRALTNMIFINSYPCDKGKGCRTKSFNYKYRTIGAGLQGFADYLIKKGISFDSPQALQIAAELSERLYYKALNTSCDLTSIYGVYEGFDKSNLGNSEFHWETYAKHYGHKLNLKMDWELLRKKIDSTCCANAMLLANAPTATSSTFSGSSPSIEPSAPIYIRDTDRGQDEVIINQKFIDALYDEGVLNNNLIGEIVSSTTGKLPNSIPERISTLYKGIYEMDPSTMTKISIMMQPFIDQGISLNQYLSTRDIKIYSDILISGWQYGEKTLVYYTRAKLDKTTQGIYANPNYSTCESCSS